MALVSVRVSRSFHRQVGSFVWVPSSAAVYGGWGFLGFEISCGLRSRSLSERFLEIWNAAPSFSQGGERMDDPCFGARQKPEKGFLGFAQRCKPIAAKGCFHLLLGASNDEDDGAWVTFLPRFFFCHCLFISFPRMCLLLAVGKYEYFFFLPHICGDSSHLDTVSSFVLGRENRSALLRFFFKTGLQGWGLGSALWFSCSAVLLFSSNQMREQDPQAEKTTRLRVIPSKSVTNPEDRIPLFRTEPVVFFLEHRRNSFGDSAPLYASEIQTATFSGGKKSKLDLKDPEQDRIQFFIRSLSGKSICKQIWTETVIKNLKDEIQADLGIPSNLLSLSHAGKILQDNFTIQHYGIGRDSTIFVSTRLRGGSPGPGPKGSGSFKDAATSKPTGSYRDAAKGKEPTKGKEHSAVNIPPRQYIVDEVPESPSIPLDIPEVECIFSDLQKKAVICRFNGFWPRTDTLYQWIHTAWTTNCQIHLCSKGFFIVIFRAEEDREKVLTEGPWFWGSAGLFVTPWFPEFDPNTMVVSRMPVWVRLHNLPIHFWHFKTLSVIGNTLGKMLKIDTERHLKGIFTFARICVEVDLSQGLPESIILNFNNTQWKQPLDYENTTFRCRGCQQTGHLFNACKSLNKSKPQQRKHKGWQNIDSVMKKRTAGKKAPSVTEDEETEAEEDDTTIEEVEIENQKENIAVNKDSQPHSNQAETQQNQAEMTSVDQGTGGIKWQHHSDTSDSDKETGHPNVSTQLVIASAEPTVGEWRKV